jgi:hydrogenase-4 component B
VAVTLFLSSVGLVLAAGVAAMVLRSMPARADGAFRILSGAGCLLGFGVAVSVLAGADVGELRIDTGLPGGSWVFGIDALSALFLVAIFVVGGASAHYGVTYLGRERSQRAVGAEHLLVAVLIASLAMVMASRAVVPFLIAWEVMALSAYLAIVFERERAEVRRAGLLYVVATHTGTLSLFGMFAVWAGETGDMTFAALSDKAPSVLGPFVWLLLPAFLGFGLKAGMIPLHFWLPSAHAAAPSHVSAILSGVVIKSGIYGIMRVVLLLGYPPAWLGWFLLVAGAVSGILGVIWALAQHDLKRLLAYHSVENIGIILLGLGAGVLGLAYEHPEVALLGFGGAALHTLNHALFKSLLFLGAGSVIQAVGTREIDRLGGLARRMPRTAVAFLIGSAAIVGLPPLNGFVSEWLVFRSLLSIFDGLEGRVAIVFTAALGLIGALALACFAKVVSVLFLGEPRGVDFRYARESESGMTGPLLLLAGVCIAIGLLPVLVVPAMLRVGALMSGAEATPRLLRDPAAVSLTILAIALTVVAAAVWWVHGRVTRARARAESDTWSCGYDRVSPRMQYTASSFAAPILVAFRPVAGVSVVRTEERYETHATDPVMDGLVLRAWRSVHDAAARIRPLQRGRLSHYLLYIVVTLVALLLYLLWG